MRLAPRTAARRSALPSGALALLCVLAWAPRVVLAQGNGNGGPDPVLDRSPGLTPKERLREAQRAFRRGNYEALRALLEPVLEPKPLLELRADRLEARALLALAYFSEAQLAAGTRARRDLMEHARTQLLALLRESPDYELDDLVYPTSVVDLVEEVRQGHAEELDRIRTQLAREADQQHKVGAGVARATGLNQVYIEREVDRSNLLFALAPFGVGQFQNGDTLLGVLFAGAQVTSLAINVGAYVAIWDRITIDPGQGTPGYTPLERLEGSEELRQVMFIAAGTFAAMWIASAAHALWRYESEAVRVRVLDVPPPELRPSPAALSPGEEATLGAPPSRWSVVGWSWQF